MMKQMDNVVNKPQTTTDNCSPDVKTRCFFCYRIAVPIYGGGKTWVTIANAKFINTFEKL